MIIPIILSSILHAATLADLSAGDLIVTEVMHSPVAALWYRGEWLELHNTTASTVDIDGLVVSDGAGETFTVSGTLEVAAGGYAILAVRAESWMNGGLPAVDYEYSRDDMSLRSKDSIVLSYGANILDSVTWDESFPLAIGQSLSLDPGAVDSSLASNWCAGWSVYGDGDGGTPGAENDDCAFSLASLSAGDLLISEMMHSPAAAAYNKGEWLEIYNNTDVYVDLEGLVVSDSGSDVFVIDESLSIAPGGHMVLAARDNPLVNGGIEDVAWRYIYGSELRLLSTDDVSLSYGAVTFDEVSWGSSYPAALGTSMQLDLDQFDALANDDVAAWCSGASTYGDGDAGTPGALNDDCINDLDGDGYEDDVDCDDSDPLVSPAAIEVCDSIDNDCDGDIDEDDASDAPTWYADLDDDLYGDPASPSPACTRPSGYRANGLDCDDTLDTVYPGAAEVSCDGIDSDCSGEDEGCAVGDGTLSLTWDFTADPQDAWVEFSQRLHAEDSYDVVSIVGDIDLNGDGTADLVVGSEQSFYTSGGDLDAALSLTSIFYGPLSGGIDVDDADVTLDSPAPYLSAAAAEVSSPGDIDGDGYDDLLVGRYVPDTSSTPDGEGGSIYRRDPGVSIFYGPVSGGLDVVDADAVLLPPSDAEIPVYHAARFFPGAHETDSTFLLQEPDEDYDGDHEVYIYAGVDTLAASIFIDTSSHFFPEAALLGGFVGDLNADGEQEVFIGDAENAAVWLFASPLSEDMIADDAACTAAGVSAARDGGLQGVSDLDDDGYDDLMLLLGSTQYVFYGPVTDLTSTAAAASTADLTLLLADDLDADGVVDVLLSEDQGLSSGGYYAADYYFFSGALLGSIDPADAILSVSDAYAERVVVGGDLSGDGLTDFLLEARTGSYGGYDVSPSVAFGALVE